MSELEFFREAVANFLARGIGLDPDAASHIPYKEIIRIYGGDERNEIVCQFDNGLILYRSVSGSHTVYNLIDPNRVFHDQSQEACIVSLVE